MRHTAKHFLKGLCFLNWGILTLIILLTLLARFSLLHTSFYSRSIKYLFWGFWGMICFSLPFLIYYQRKFAREKLAEISTRREGIRGADYFKLYFKYFSGEPSPITLTIIFIIVNLAIIFESFLLIKPVIYMWILIFALSLIAILSKITPANKIIKYHITFITVLNSTILIFAVFALSDPFHKSFLASTGWIDKTIFSNAAAIEGPPGTPLMEHKIAKIHSFETRKTSVQSYLDTFKAYTDNLKKNNLDENLLPQNKVKDETSVHALFIGKAFATLEAETVPKLEKQKVIETLLDYLTIVTKGGYIDEIDRQDREHKIDIIFLGKLHDLIIHQNLETWKWKCFLCRIKEHTKINISRFGIPLGKKECEPCLKN